VTAINHFYEKEEIVNVLFEMRERLLKWAYNETENYHDAEDIFGETCVAVAEKDMRLIFPKPYLRGIFSKKIIEYKRKKFGRNGLKPLERQIRDFEIDEDKSLICPVSREADPIDLAMRNEAIDLVSNEMRYLPDRIVSEDENLSLILREIKKLCKKDKEVLLLRYYGNLGYDEISSILGVKKSTVDTHLMRARKELEESESLRRIYKAAG
jgi:RNA polymerase sigma factor (sigma-70 family)